MKIIIDENIPFLEGRIPGAEVKAMPAGKIDREAVRDADALIIRTRTRCDASLLEGSRVKVVATATIGVDHIDQPWCRSHGIEVRNAPGCNAPGVATYVWASLLRQGFDPTKSTIGIIGCGNVGSIVAEWGRRLGARVLACDPPRKKAGYTDHEYMALEDVLAASDAVTLHTPLTRAGECPTFHLIDEDALRHLKKGATLVNAARGPVIDTRAVCDAIRDGRISKTIIDTWEGEPDIDSELLELADTATCHIAGYSLQGKQRASRMALEAVGKCLGIPVIIDDLQGAYAEPAQLTADLIMEKFDPSTLTAALKSQGAGCFESMRNSYTLHQEVL